MQESAIKNLQIFTHSEILKEKNTIQQVTVVCGELFYIIEFDKLCKNDPSEFICTCTYFSPDI